MRIRNQWRNAALAGAAVATFFAVRDLVGFHDPLLVTNLTYRFYDHLWGFVRLLMVFVAGTVAWWGAEGRRSKTLAAALIGMAFNNNWWFYSTDNPLLWPSVALNYLGLAFGLAQALRFAATYGRGDWHGVRAIIERAAPFIGLLVAIFGTSWWVSRLVFGVLWPQLDVLFWLAWDAVNVLLIVASVIAAARAEEAERTRTLWVAASFAIAAAGTALHGLDRLVQGDKPWANTVDTLAQLALPLGLGYAVLRLRALESDFLINRLALFSALTTFMGLVFMAAEVVTHGFVSSLKFIPESSRIPESGVEFALSISVVFGFKKLEHWADARLEHIKETDSDERSVEISKLKHRLAELESAESTNP